jgi:hypothetical protein
MEKEQAKKILENIKNLESSFKGSTNQFQKELLAEKNFLLIRKVGR